jgi:hypothetical protein
MSAVGSKDALAVPLLHKVDAFSVSASWMKPVCQSALDWDPASKLHAESHLEKDRQALLAFYDFPAEHWKHLRTSNAIESTFATVRHRTIRQGLSIESHGAGHGVQARRGRAEKLATTRWAQPVAQARARCQVHEGRIVSETPGLATNNGSRRSTAVS